MKTYDSKKGTNFADQLNVDEPDEATPMSELEVDFMESKRRSSPVSTMEKLLRHFKEIKVTTLKTQAEFLAPMLQEIHQQAAELLKVIEAVGEKEEE
jgi:sulfate adenylyltransferase subunit 1 (EFTu-like GTPase family)